MNALTKHQVDALAAEVVGIVERRGHVAAEYATEFAAYAAGFAASLIASPDPDALDRFEAQARGVAETIKEISDQAVEDILGEVVTALRFVLVIAGNTPI